MRQLKLCGAQLPEDYPVLLHDMRNARYTIARRA
ncbi:hypothetical protein A2U01_0081339, partial [Trifolium medium]|nr:hypothetical protein [Trifolium medium]